MFPKSGNSQRNGQNLAVIEIKSKFDAEFRRFSGERSKLSKFDDFQKILQTLHRLHDTPFIITYIDANSEDLLPINNDENCARALSTAKPLLRIIIQRKGESYYEMVGYGVTAGKKKGGLGKLVGSPQQATASKLPRPALVISMPEDFRRVSSIIDVDILPEQLRRVRLCKHGTERPLGFFIRDGTSIRVGPNGIEKVPGIFISRLIPGGLAESTGLLAVNDEVVEVNGIDVAEKSLDQVTDMMIANASNLILTVKPFNQRAIVQRKTKPAGDSASNQYASLSQVGALSTQSLNVPSSAPLQSALSTQSVNLPSSDSFDGHAKNAAVRPSMMAIGENEADARSLDDEDAVRDYTVKSAQPSPSVPGAPNFSSTDPPTQPSAATSPTASTGKNGTSKPSPPAKPNTAESATASPSRAKEPVAAAGSKNDESDSEMTI